MDENIIPRTKELISNLELFEKEEANKQFKHSFNIFDAIPRRHYEDIHNRMLYYLLNPKEKHGCGGLFLNCFLEEIRPLLSEQHMNILNNLKTEEVFVLLEHPESNCGRVDVIITDKKSNHIIIENKINGATDQKQQLIRYKKKWKGGILLYLSKNGSKPTDKSIRKRNNHKLKEKDDFYTISYKKQISSFLDKSYAELGEQKYLSARMGIDSYVKHLNETLLKNTPIMDKTVKLLIDSCPELLKYINIDTIGEVNQSIRKEFLISLKELLSKDRSWDFVNFDEIDLNQKVIPIAAHQKLSGKLAKTMVILGKSNSTLHYGIESSQIANSKADEIQRKFIDRKIEVENNGYWIDVCFEIECNNETYDFWDNEVNYELIINRDKHLKKLKEDIDNFVEAYKHMRLG